MADIAAHLARTRRLAYGLLVCWVLIATVGLVGLFLNHVHEHATLHRATIALQRANVAIAATETLEQRQEQTLVKLCHRLNLVRAAANVTGYVAWDVLRSVPRYRNLRVRLIWVPLTHNCMHVVALDGLYVTPPPVLFDQARPNAADLSIHPGD